MKKPHLSVSIVVFATLLPLAFLSCGTTGTQHGIDAAGVKALLEDDSRAVMLDVRTAEEFQSGHIPGARLLPYDSIDENTAAELISSKDSPVIVYCRTGRRSAAAAETLRRLGYTAVFDFGAVTSWPWELVSQP